jgi:hypothetical protein
VSPTARALVRRLLIKDPKRRLGAQRGAWIELRPHPFFQVPGGVWGGLVVARRIFDIHFDCALFSKRLVILSLSLSFVFF